MYRLFNVLVGWPCPLTHVENWGRLRAGEATLPGSGFIDHYIAGVVYPQEREVAVQVLVAAVVLASWIGFGLRRRHAVRHESRRVYFSSPSGDTRVRYPFLAVMSRPGPSVHAWASRATVGHSVPEQTGSLWSAPGITTVDQGGAWSATRALSTGDESWSP